AYYEWSSWAPPTDRKMQYQSRDKVKTRFMVLAHLAIQTVRAKKSGEELKEEMSMLKYALDQAKPLSEVKAEQVARRTPKMEDLKKTKCRIATLEAQVGELEFDIEDTKTVVAETEKQDCRRAPRHHARACWCRNDGRDEDDGTKGSSRNA
ncbi:unnamed protein product, partial [Prorocentrum cordatum]